MRLSGIGLPVGRQCYDTCCGMALQFHIAKGPEAQRTPLPVQLVLPDHDSLIERLELVQSQLEGTQFAFEQREDSVLVTDPFGQQFEVLQPSDDDTFSRGIKDIRLPCAPGTAAAIGAFYEKFYKVITKLRTTGICHMLLAIMHPTPVRMAAL